MKQKKTEEKKDNFVKIMVFSAIYFYLFFWAIIPFIQHNNLLNYDMTGMYFSAWHTKNYLYPEITGWNKFFFFGYPQNYFYGPFFPYLVATIAQIIPIDIAFKIALSIFIILTPIAFYHFSKSIGLKQNSALASTLIMTSLLIIAPPKSYGGDLYSTLGTGLIANAVALPILFFYLGELAKIQKENYIKQALLLGLLIITHPLTAIIGIIATISHLIIYSIKEKEKIEPTIKQFIIGALITAFWWIPAIITREEAEIARIGSIEDATMLLGLFLVVLAIAISQKNKAIYPTITTIALILVFSIIGTSIIDIPTHFYRFTIIILLLLPPIFFSIIKLDHKAIAFATTIYFLIVIFNVQYYSPEGYSKLTRYDLETIKQNCPPENTRTLINAPPTTAQTPHEIQHAIPMQCNNVAVRGIYSESSRNSVFVFYLEKELDETNFDWGVSVDKQFVIDNKEKLMKLMPWQLEALGINYIISAEQHAESWKKTKDVLKTEVNNEYTEGPKEVEYSLYKVSDSKIFEVPTKELIKVDTQEWKNKTVNWFLSEEIINTLPIQNLPKELQQTKQENTETKITIIEENKRGDKYKIFIESEKEVPVLAKISYFPNWKAKQEGKEINIYRAAPNFMMFFAKGEVELSYEKTNYEIISYLISIITLLIVINKAIKKDF
ncbi:MAG: 6-pyruvoyl-tetrahydropterin synthase-related protein [Candidatus Diapherotrites archaeon]